MIIKPNSYPNSINLGSNGVVPVAIFGSTTFNKEEIIRKLAEQKP